MQHRSWLTPVLGLLVALWPALTTAQPLAYVTSVTPGPSSQVELHVINTATGNRVAVIPIAPHPGGTTPQVVITPDRRTAWVTAGGDGLYEVDILTGSVRSRNVGTGLEALALTADGTRLYVGAQRGATLQTPPRIYVVDTATGQTTGQPILLPSTRPARLAVSADGATVFALGQVTDEAVYVASTISRTVVLTINTQASPFDMVPHPDGTRLFVGHTHLGEDTLVAYDTSSGAAVGTLTLPAFTGQVGFFEQGSVVKQMAILPSGSTLYIPRFVGGFANLSGFVRYEEVVVVDVSTLTVTTRLDLPTTSEQPSPGLGAVALADGTQVVVAGAGGATIIDPATNNLAAAGPGVLNAQWVAAAAPPPCWGEVSPQRVFARTGGATVEVAIPLADGCPWSATQTGDFFSVSPTQGTGPSTVTIQVAAGDVPRMGSVLVLGQTVNIERVVPQVVIESPAAGTVTLPIVLSGWAVERGVPPTTGPTAGLLNAIVYDQAGVGPQTLLRTIGVTGQRPDVAALYGEQYLLSGFNTKVGRLSAGTHTLSVQPRSVRDGALLPPATVTVEVVRQPRLVIDLPKNLDEVTQPFTFRGWAADMTVPSGVGVDSVQVWAQPTSGGPAVSLGAATTGIIRGDVGAYFNEQPLAAGFTRQVSGLPAGRYTLTATAHYTAGGSVSASVTVDIIVTTDPPIGRVDSPAQNTTGVQGALAITGWVVDDEGIERVRIYRQCLGFDNPQSCQSVLGTSLVFVGDAAVLPGARPDVEAAFPSYPSSNVAGWGFLILSNMLPNIPASTTRGGVGTFQLYAVAKDQDGHERILGRTAQTSEPTVVTASNDTIAKPFGTIDTPGQRSTVSGLLHNFGWVLTPDTSSLGTLIPIDGSTITVFVDGAPVGTAQYNLCRGTVGNPVPAGVLCDDDVSTLFRGDGTRYRNLDAARGAIGLRSIDTTLLSNGLHTISWGVTDSASRAEGIGSRFFTVSNVGGRQARTPEPRDSGTSGLRDPGTSALPDPGTPIWARTGFDLGAAYTPLERNADGVPQVRIPEHGRVELQIPGVVSGVMIANGTERVLPIGVGIDRERGIVTWVAGPGYLGTYRLRFEVPGARGPEVLGAPAAPNFVWVDITVASASTVGGNVRMRLDRADVKGVNFTLHGWAVDPQAATGAGIGTVHVWGRRKMSSEAISGEIASELIFLGIAQLGVPRPDVAAAHGEHMPYSGFVLHGALPDAGEWEITAYVWVTRTGRFEDARTVTVVR